MCRVKLLPTLVLLCGLVLAAAGQTGEGRVLPTDYVSDRCSMFPDGDYGDCCVEHDKAYFFGGTKRERRAADNELYECVKGKGHNFIGKMMWVGVRIGGAAFLPTPFRWGFGKNWPKQSTGR